MTLQQLRCLCQLADCGFNISRAAAQLHVSQPGVSRQLRLLEEELGFPLLLRRRTRIGGVTAEGAVVLEKARRVVREIGDLRVMRDEIVNARDGSLVVATTHFHARYTLLDVVNRFRVQYPDVSVTIRQDGPQAIARMVLAGQAVLGLCARPGAGEQLEELHYVTALEVRRVIIVPRDHPLLRVRRPTLAQLAQYPIVAYDSKFSGGWRVLEVFDRAGIRPKVVLRATDADVIKAYVASGLGIAVIQEPAYDPKRDTVLRTVPAPAVFEPVTAVLMLRRGGYVPRYVEAFIRELAPQLVPGPGRAGGVMLSGLA